MKTELVLSAMGRASGLLTITMMAAQKLPNICSFDYYKPGDTYPSHHVPHYTNEGRTKVLPDAVIFQQNLAIFGTYLQ